LAGNDGVIFLAGNVKSIRKAVFKGRNSP
jgi:hypothetical protein